MADQVTVFVYAGDPISQAGMAVALGSRTELRLVDSPDAAAVAVMVADEVDEATLRTVTAIQRHGCPKVVLVATRLDDKGLLSAIEAGATNLVRRAEADPDRIVAAVIAAAAGEGTVPPDLLGRLLAGVGRLQRQVLGPRGLSITGMSEREIAILQLLAEGCEIPEIARRLAFSERTIKNQVQTILVELGVKNRSHAVASAVRQGLI